MGKLVCGSDTVEKNQKATNKITNVRRIASGSLQKRTVIKVIHYLLWFAAALLLCVFRFHFSHSRNETLYK